MLISGDDWVDVAIIVDLELLLLRSVLNTLSVEVPVEELMVITVQGQDLNIAMHLVVVTCD